MKKFWLVLSGAALMALAGVSRVDAADPQVFTDPLLKLDVIMPSNLFPSIHGQIDLEHQANASRAPQSDEVTEKIRYFIYKENGHENDRFDPARGEGILELETIPESQF